MCHFITAILPANVKLDSLRLIARDHARALTEVHNPHVTSQLQPSEHYYLTTLGSCDCGPVLGAQPRRDRLSHAKEPTEREIAALRRRRWSETKIERWLLQHSLATAHDTRRQRVQAEGSAHEASSWQQFIKEVLASGGTAFVGLLLHWYHGSIDGERIQIRQRRIIRQTDTTPDLLMRLPEDELYVFTP